jgi:hypothetical protein
MDIYPVRVEFQKGTAAKEFSVMAKDLQPLRDAVGSHNVTVVNIGWSPAAPDECPQVTINGKLVTNLEIRAPRTTG